MRNPIVRGTMAMPAHSGVWLKPKPCCGSQMPCRQMISMNWMPPRPRAASRPAMLPAVNARILNRSSRNIGCATLVSTQPNRIRMAIPPKMPASTQGLVHPGGGPAERQRGVHDAGEQRDKADGEQRVAQPVDLGRDADPVVAELEVGPDRAEQAERDRDQEDEPPLDGGEHSAQDQAE